MRPAGRIPAPFKAILALLPKHLRAEHEEELRQFLDLEMPERRGERVAYWWMTLFDVLRASPTAHLDILRQDLVLALRQLRRAPGYSVIAVATLALGIAGNAGLFTIVDHTLLQPPPFIDADRLVSLSEENQERGLLRFGMNPANFVDFVSGAEGLIEASATWQNRSGTVLLGDAPDRVSYAAVSGGFFRVFKEPAVLGRSLRPEDDLPGSDAAVLAHSFWVSRLGADPDAIGRRFTINGFTHRVVGVMPEGFAYPGESTDLWTSLALSDDDLSRRGPRWLGATLRLAAGVDPAQVAERTTATALALSSRYPGTNGGWSTSVITLGEAAARDLRTPLLIIWSAAVLILIIAVANVANLLLGRAVARREEMALRRALGARGSRLVRQTLTEGAVLAALGATLGLGLAALLLGRVREGGLGIFPRAADIALDGRAIAFTALLAAAVTMLFSVVPALLERSARAGRALRNRRSGRSVERARVQTGLVIGEIALAVVVAVGTGLLARSAARLLDQPLGYSPSEVTTFRIEPPMRVDPDQPLPDLIQAIGEDRVRATSAYSALLERLRAEPGIVRAGAVSRLPLTGRWWITGFDIPGAATEDDYVAYIRVVTPGYLEAMDTGWLEGRSLQATDAGASERVVVIDQTFARRYFAGRSPIGEVIHLDGPPDAPPPTARIVGVVETIRQADLESEPRATYYITLAQALEGHSSDWGMDVVVRSSGTSVGEDVIRAHALDFFPDAAVFRVLPMAELVSAAFAGRRLQLALFGGFATLALTLTMVGVFGVLALHVRERTREFGVRIAVGATPWRIRWLVQRNALLCVAWGSAIGLVTAALVGRAFQSVVYGVSVYDPLSFVIGPVALTLVALAGGLIPAWRATRADPAKVLRTE